MMIIDSELPDMSGQEVCRTTQSMNYHIPIILLSAMGGNRVFGPNSSQPDGIINKPVEVARLLKEVNQQLQTYNPDLDVDNSSVLSLGSVQVDLKSQTVYTTGGTQELTDRETELLRYLDKHPNKPIKRKNLLENVWQYQNTTNTRTVDVHIAKLRSKIEQDPSNPDLIITIHGVGYMLNKE
jgi:DNA-binding response OmpR family regulator